MRTIFIWLFALVMLVAGSARADGPVLGPGDVMRVSVFGNPELTLETRVRESGSISYPLLGEVPVSGLAISAAERRIADLLESGGFVRKPRVNIHLTVLESQQVSVLGQVNRPGRYPMGGARTLVEILALAGGLSADGGDVVTIIRRRDGKTTSEKVDIPQMMREGDMSGNVELMGSDVVYVERASEFYIYGEVQRPGVYRLERNMSVIQALATAGGLSPRGTEHGVSIKRRNQSGQLVETAVRHEDLLKADDVIYIRESLF